MNVQEWIALASVIVFVLVQAMAYAFISGGLFARVRRIETDHTDNNALALCVATLTANVASMKDQITEVRDMMLERQPRRRAASD